MTTDHDTEQGHALDAQRVHGMILSAARRQVETAAVARKILDAGLRDDLMDLLVQIAANAANPIAEAAADAVDAAVAESASAARLR